MSCISSAAGAASVCGSMARTISPADDDLAADAWDALVDVPKAVN
jgi:hypothetical protein